MDDAKNVALFIFVIAVIGLYLNWQGKLLKTLEIMAEPSDSEVKLGTFALAFIVLLFVLSLVPAKTGGWLVGLLVAGALIANADKKGDKSVISTLLGGS
jgi:hypothetical protein